METTVFLETKVDGNNLDLRIALELKYTRADSMHPQANISQGRNFECNLRAEMYSTLKVGAADINHKARDRRKMKRIEKTHQ